MRYFISLMAITGLAVMPAAAQSGSPSTIFYVNTGLGIPSSPETFSDQWSMGFTVGAGYGVALSPVLSIQGNVDYTRFSFDSQGFLSDLGLGGTGIEIDGAAATIITVMGNLKAGLQTEGNLTPYAVGGLGLFRISAGDVKVSGLGASTSAEGESEMRLGLGLGVGVDVAFTPQYGLFLEGRYTVGFTEDNSTSFFPLRAGLSIKN